MKDAALTWQEKAIKSINEAAANLQQDNKKVLRDIKSETSQETKELRKQLETMSKKHADLQTEHNFTSAALALKNKMETLIKGHKFRHFKNHGTHNGIRRTKEIK